MTEVTVTKVTVLRWAQLSGTNPKAPLSLAGFPALALRSLLLELAILAAPNFKQVLQACEIVQGADYLVKPARNLANECSILRFTVGFIVA